MQQIFKLNRKRFKNMKALRKVVLLAVVIVLGAGKVCGQTLDDAIEAQNKAGELKMQGDIPGAIAALENCIELCLAIGDEAEEQRVQAENYIPNLHFEIAKGLLKDKNYPEALAAFEKTIAAAEKYNVPALKEAAEENVPKVYFASGVAEFQAKNYQDAAKHLQRAAELDKENVKACYYLGLAYQNLKDEENMAEAFKSAAALSAHDKATAGKAATSFGKYFYNKGITSMKGKQWEAAIGAFFIATEVEHELLGDVYYRMASAYNSWGKPTEAIAACEKALPLKQSNDPKTTDGVYYELGTAYQAKNDKANACAAYRNVTSAPFLEGAKYQIQTALKCQ